MNLAAYLSGCWQAFRGGADWPAYMTLSRRGLYESYIALLLTLPAYYVCALGLAAQHARLSAEKLQGFPLAPFALAALIYTLTFSAGIYLITAAGRQDRFAPWAILRHWSHFFCTLFAAAFFGFYLLGLMPFTAAAFIAFAVYAATLLIDIRLAQRIGGFGWTGAVLIGCALKAAEMSVLLISIVHMSQIGGA